MEKQKPKYWKTKREIRLHKKYEEESGNEFIVLMDGKDAKTLSPHFIIMEEQNKKEGVIEHI